MEQKLLIKHYLADQKESTLSQANDNIEAWVSYWRANPHRFITEYLGGELYDFQKVLLYGMDKYPYFIYAASRGLAKTSVGAWFAVERAILYPRQQICVTAFEKPQAIEFIKRIETYSKLYPNLAREIYDLKTGINDACVEFKNGSSIRVKTNSEGGRSARFHILIVDEFALFKNRDIINKVFEPTLTNTRRPPYKALTKDQRLKYVENNKEIYLSSIRTEAEWSWQYFLKCINFMISGNKKYLPIALPYHYGVKNGYITEEVVAKQFRENGSEGYDITRAEYEAIPVRTDANSFLQYDSFDKARESTDVLISMSNEEYVQWHDPEISKDKKRHWKFYKEKKVSKDNPKYNELRIMSIDIALMGGSINDNTVIDIFRCQPSSKGYKKLLAYSETMHGQHHKEQALRIKQLFYELECDYVIIDAAGNGVSVAESLMDYTEDPYRGITYDPWSLANPEEVNLNTLNTVTTGVPVMYGIKASAAENHSIYTTAKSYLESGDIELPVTESEAQSFFETQYEYYKITDGNLKQRLMNTFAQTSMLVIESTNLVTSTVGAYIKLEPKSGRRKDRFTAFVYGLYLIKRLEDNYKSSMLSDDNDLLNDYTFFA